MFISYCLMFYVYDVYSSYDKVSNIMKIPKSIHPWVLAFILPILLIIMVVLFQDIWNNGILVLLTGRPIGIHASLDVLCLACGVSLVIYGLKEVK